MEFSHHLNPFAVSYVPLAKREVQDVNKESKTVLGEAAVDDLKLKHHQAYTAYGTQADIPQQTNTDVMDEETEMDLAYLQMMFPGVSDQSLADVYNVNGGDLEAAVDMLSELESIDDHLQAVNNDKIVQPVSFGEPLSMNAVSVPGESIKASGPPRVTVATP